MIKPRFRSVPRSSRSLGPETVDLAASAGLELDDWQQHVVVDALGVRDDGRWSAPEVGVVASRQNGKGGIVEARSLAGLFLVPTDRLQIYSAHLFKTSSEALTRLEFLIQNTPDLHAKVRPRGGYKHSHGEEGIYLRNGKRILFSTRTKGGGRGLSCDNLFFDEAMFLADRVIGALLPTLSARTNPQRWYLGSAVDQVVHQDGVVFARVRERGIAGDDPELAFFEWSCGVDDPDDVTPALARDPKLWRKANPAIGIRISEAWVEHEQRTMPAREFAVERLAAGDWPFTGTDVQSVIDLAAWDRLEDKKSEPLDPVCFAFDVTPRRSSSAIAAAGYRADGLPHVEVIEHGPGTGWVAGRIAELDAKHRPAAIGYGKDGPAESLAPDLTRLRLDDIVGLTVAENAAGCGRLFDAVEQAALRHIGDRSPQGAALRAALAGAAQKPSGDKWLWSRAKSNVDISPLVAATLALYLLATQVTFRSSEPLVAFA